MAVAGPLTSRDNTAIGLNHTIVPARDHIARAVAIEIAIEIAELPLRRNDGTSDRKRQHLLSAVAPPFEQRPPGAWQSRRAAGLLRLGKMVS
jgi:hypothetical protein